MPELFTGKPPAMLHKLYPGEWDPDKTFTFLLPNPSLHVSGFIVATCSTYAISAEKAFLGMNQVLI